MYHHHHQHRDDDDDELLASWLSLDIGHSPTATDPFELPVDTDRLIDDCDFADMTSSSAFTGVADLGFVFSFPPPPAAPVPCPNADIADNGSRDAALPVVDPDTAEVHTRAQYHHAVRRYLEKRATRTYRKRVRYASRSEGARKKKRNANGAFARSDE